MHLAAFLAASGMLLSASAGPLVKRQDESTSAALDPVTLSNGDVSTIPVDPPKSTTLASTSASTTTTAVEEATKTSSSAAVTSSASKIPENAGYLFPTCTDSNAKPFCLPENNTLLYVDNTYYATWNSDFFPETSNVTVTVMMRNDTTQEIWTSEETTNESGYVRVGVTKEWLQGYDIFDLTFVALNSGFKDPAQRAIAYDGPTVTIQRPPKKHLPPSSTTKFHKEGLMIGLPVGLGFVALVIAGLWFGMRKHRTIGLGNIMGRNRGYGTGKSKRQRLGLGKSGAIKLGDRQPQSREPRNLPLAHSHSRGDSLGSLVSEGDDDIRAVPIGNQFREEIHRQKTGR